MFEPWSVISVDDNAINICLYGAPAFNLRRETGAGLLWELRRHKEANVVEASQYRHDLMSAVQSGRFKPNFNSVIEIAWPDRPKVQALSLATYMELGWKVGGIGRCGEIELARGDGLNTRKGYVRADGVYRDS